MKYTLDELYNVQGKAVVISGGTSGIGLELAGALLDLGAKVAVLGHEESSTQKAKESLEKRGDTSVPAFTVNVTDLAGVTEVFQKIFQEFGRIDGLVNCAGINSIEALHSANMEKYRQVLDVNLMGTIHCCRAVAPYMLAQNSGRVVNISSLSSIRGKRYYTAYASSKAAINGFTRALAVEWAQNGITVNAIAPGMIVTAINRREIEENPESYQKRVESIPRGCAGRTEWLVAPVVMFLSDGAPHVTGQCLFCDGGSSIGDTFIMEKEKQGPLKI